MEQCMHRKQTLGSKIQSHIHSIQNQYQYTLSQNREHFLNGQKSRKQNYLHSKCSHVKNATWKALQPEMKQMRHTHKKELQCIQNEKETRVQCLQTEMERDYKIKMGQYQDECRGRMQVNREGGDGWSIFYRNRHRKGPGSNNNISNKCNNLMKRARRIHTNSRSSSHYHRTNSQGDGKATAAAKT